MAQTVNINTPSYTSRAYNSANFAANGGNIIGTSDEYVDRYKVIGKTLFWHFSLTCDFNSTPDYITIKLPNSYTTRDVITGVGVVVSSLTDVVYGTQASSNLLQIARNSGAFTDISTIISFNLTLEIE
jgi:hypothetical protein